MDKEESKIYLRVLVFCLLLAIVIIGFIISFVRQQKKLVQEKLGAEINAREQEKKKLATDLHDDIGPLLAAIKLYVNALSQNEEKEKELIGNINKYLDNTVKHVRLMANGLTSNTLQRKGLLNALQEHISNIELYVPFEIHFLPEIAGVGLTEDAALNIYRIVQEIITNTIKHANAGVLEIALVKNNSNLEIWTSDDGVGFEYTDHNFVSTGNGISNIKSRVELLGGKYSLYSRNSEGTRFAIEIPIKRNSKK